MINEPNIFNYATSELSQDALICWLLDWANPVYADLDSDLNQVAIVFIKALFKKHEIELPYIQQIQVRRQDNNIDVAAVVNDRYFLLIEDKKIHRIIRDS